MQKKELAVGDSTILEIIFSTKTFRNRVSKRPRIQTNEGPPDKYVQIIANVVARPDSTYPLILKPYKLDLSQFGEKIRSKINFEITNVSDHELDLELIAVAGKLFEVKLPKSIKPGKTKKGTLKLTQAGIDASFAKSFTMEVSDEKLSRFTMPIKRTLRKTTESTRVSADSLPPGR